MTIYYTFHETYGEITKTEQLEGRFENRTLHRVGPSWNNGGAPFVYASDDLGDFAYTLTRNGVPISRKMMNALRSAPIGIFGAVTP